MIWNRLTKRLPNTARKLCRNRCGAWIVKECREKGENRESGILSFLENKIVN